MDRQQLAVLEMAVEARIELPGLNLSPLSGCYPLLPPHRQATGECRFTFSVRECGFCAERVEIDTPHPKVRSLAG